MDTKYNGWANYETWCIALWLGNEEHNYRYWRDAAQQAAKDAPDSPQVKEGLWTVEEAAINQFADQLHAQVHDSERLKDSEFCMDMLLAALRAVDWCEIAADFLGDFLSPEKQAASPALTKPDQPRFSLGKIALTPGALKTLAKGAFRTALERHVRGDWGLVDAEDAAENELALREGFRLFSVYEDAELTRFWVITEADRSSTTILLPDEY